MGKKMVRRIGLTVLFVVCLILLVACGEKSGTADKPKSDQSTEVQSGKKTEKEEKKDSSEVSGVEELKDENPIPDDGIITKEQFATVTGQDRDIRFLGETPDGITYTWTYHASQIQNPQDQNLKITFDSDNLEDIKKAANNANDALKMTMRGKGLICPPTLTIKLPEAWQSDTGMLLKEQDEQLAKMSDVTIESQSAKKDSSGEESTQESTEVSIDTNIDSLTAPTEGTTTLTMTVLSLEGECYIVGGITDVDKLATINQRAQAIAGANANAGSGYVDSGSSDYGSEDSNGDSGASSGNKSGSSSKSDKKSSGSSSKKGSSGGVEYSESGSGSGSSSSKTCTLSISCSTILNNMGNLTAGKEEFVPSDGWILKPTTVTFTDGESVHDILQRVCKDKGIHMESSFTPAYNSAYVEGINQLYEFDCGELSGWMYHVNGWFPNYGCSKYTVADGDVICWVYTCDLGKDVGGESAVN